jgi:hypothetical protein
MPPPPTAVFGAARVDERAPDTRIATPLWVDARGRRVTVTFKSTERGALFQCKLDRGSWTPCRSPKAFRRLGTGWHTFRVRARDFAGNLDPTPAIRRLRLG